MTIQKDEKILDDKITYNVRSQENLELEQIKQDE